MDERNVMKIFMKCAPPLMMLGFPVLLFAANVLLLNIQSKHQYMTEENKADVRLGALCDPESDSTLSISGVFRGGSKFYRCVRIFNAQYHPIGAAWVEEGVSAQEIVLSSN